jgi:hypothetical protein
MDLQKLCLDLIYSETEEKVIDLLKKESLWDDYSSWRYYGDNENNFATIGNQQSKPESALVEKIINSIDAVLMAECLKRKIDPESEKAPQSISDALIDYFRIQEGKLSNMQPRERGKLAENICVVATGTKMNPSYTIIDKGEGQTPKKMPETLLSLAKSNKLRIPFVQGKFNMGGTGVLQFCGKKNIQLIISKRHPDIAKFESDETKSRWGFTVVRREDPSKGMRSSTYKYLAPKGEVPSFEADCLEILPGEYPEPYSQELFWGTFIKLFEYQIGPLRTAIVFDLYNKLSILMPSMALPVRLYERRTGYSGHTQETTLSGLSVRLDEDKKENIEEGFPASSTISAQGQKINASIYAFKENQSEKYMKDEGIIFTIEGLTRESISKIFFTRKAVKMGYLLNSILVICDCSSFNGRTREDLFMNSRDRFRFADLRSDIESKLEDLISNNAGLKDLRAKRRQEEIVNKIGDSKPLADVVEQILKKSPVLSKLFIEGVRITNPFKLEKAKADTKFTGKSFPTYFNLIEKYPENNPKTCPINNKKFRVQYKTDAINDYFNRDSNPGKFILKVNNDEIADFVLNLWNGVANLNVSLPSNVQIGDILHFESYVNDINKVEPLVEEFYVTITNPVEKNGGNHGTRKPPDNKEKGADTEKQSSLDLPNIIEVSREHWAEHSFDENSALEVKQGEEGYDFYVNIDNICLKIEQKTNTDIDPKLLGARYEYGMVLIGLALLRNQENKEDKNAEEVVNVFNKISETTRLISPFLLPMIASLGNLNIEENNNISFES